MAIAIAEVLVSTRKSPESAQIGERLRAVRNERALTAREVAIGMGLTSPESYRQYEKGHIRNWPIAVPKLARGLHIDPAQLADRLGVPFDPAVTDLEDRIYQALGPERAHLAGRIFDEVVGLPPDLQDKALEMMWFSVRGVGADLRSS